MGSNVNSPWTEARIADLVRLWSHGYSCAQIGAIVGVTRNAVIGKAHRLKLPNQACNVNGQKRMVDPIPAETPRSSSPRKRGPQTVFKSREQKPRARVINPNAKPALTTVYSILTGAATTLARRRPPSLGRQMTKDEMRAMLTLAVLNTGGTQ